MVGVITTKDAMKMAQEQGLDLVEVSPNANPPVCRIMDFGKFRYDESIREKEARKMAHKHGLKEVKFHANVGEHDFEYKVGHIKDFLGKGHKVKVSLQFRGRENAHRELGFQVITRVVKECQDVSMVEMDPRMMGSTIVTMLGVWPAGKKHELRPIKVPAGIPTGGQGKPAAVGAGNRPQVAAPQAPAPGPAPSPASSSAPAQTEPPPPAASPAATPTVGPFTPPSA